MRHLNLKRKEVRIVLLVLLLWIITLVAGIKTNNNNNWQYNDPHYSNAQYAKLFDRVTGGNPGNRESFGQPQYQYVDYQPNCKSGGQPVCATNGIKFFSFENDCKLEAHNLKLLFQYGTELEPTELERCLHHCEGIKCTTKYAPICAAPLSGPHQGEGVTFANECEVRRRECITRETQQVLNNGPCQQQKFKSKPKSRSKGRRKQRRRGNSTVSTTSTTIAPPIANTITPSVESTTNLIKFPALTQVLRTTTTTTTTRRPMQFHEYLSNLNPGVSLSRPVNAYDVYNIPDVGRDYDEITDSSLSVYLPGIGTVTDTPPKTSSTTTTTTTTTTRTTPQSRATSLPTTSSTIATTLPPKTATPESIFIIVPYKKNLTATVKARNVTSKVGNSGSNRASSNVSRSGPVIFISASGATKFTDTTKTTMKNSLTLARNATVFKVNAKTTAKPKQRPIPMPNVHKTTK